MKRASMISMLVALIALFPAISAFAQPAQMTTEEAMYAGRVSTWTDMAAASLNRVAELSASPQFGNLQWENDVLAETGVWSALYQNVMSADPPGRFSETHEHTLKAFIALDQAGVHLRAGIENYDVDEINASVPYMNIVSSEIQLATSAFK